MEKRFCFYCGRRQDSWFLDGRSMRMRKVTARQFRNAEGRVMLLCENCEKKLAATSTLHLVESDN